MREAWKDPVRGTSNVFRAEPKGPRDVDNVPVKNAAHRRELVDLHQHGLESHFSLVQRPDVIRYALSLLL